MELHIGPANDTSYASDAARSARHSEFSRPIPDRVEASLRRLDRFAYLLDNAYRIPLTRRRIGLDGIVGLVPGIGDGITALIALYPLLEAWRLGASSTVLLRMLANIGADALLGVVPIAGDLLDFVFKANRRNVALLRRHLGRD
ncbi:MAG: DUF4112 domain-containing protein [Geminicoccaceae bacterium]